MACISETAIHRAINSYHMGKKQGPYATSGTFFKFHLGSMRKYVNFKISLYVSRKQLSVEPSFKRPVVERESICNFWIFFFFIFQVSCLDKQFLKSARISKTAAQRVNIGSILEHMA